MSDVDPSHFMPSMRLGDLVLGLVSNVSDHADTLISGVSLDSRLACKGDLYLAVAGASTHGIEFVVQALKKEVAAVAFDGLSVQQYPEQLALLQTSGVACVEIKELKQHVGSIAASFYRHPSRQLRIVAVTGTDGKTSVCRFIANALNSLGSCCGYIGTVGWGIEPLKVTELTTPDAVSLQKMLAIMLHQGAQVVALEASSHGLEEGRLDSVNVELAVLTNFGRDHLDYHHDIAHYRAAKARLFQWPELKQVIINGNDELGESLLSSMTLQATAFYPQGLSATHQSTTHTVRTVSANAIVLHDDGLHFELQENEQKWPLHSELMGRFNVDNLLACYSVIRALGVAANDANQALTQVKAVDGRLEQFKQAGYATAIVDFAHTPQALAAVIATLRTHCQGQLWVVFGCGGDRDAGKREPMGRAAEAADHIVVTDDNPRTEQSSTILKAIVAGMQQPQRAVVINDRAQAITYALSHAALNDIVLIAGKGHETYQIVGTEKRHFSDRETVQSLLKGVC